MQRQIKVLVVEPNKLPKIQLISNNDSTKEKIIGGKLNYLYNDSYPNVVIICNDQDGSKKLPLNRLIETNCITGTFIIVRDDPKMGEDRSLTDKQIKKYEKIFDEKSIFRTNFFKELRKQNIKNNDLSI